MFKMFIDEMIAKVEAKLNQTGYSLVELTVIPRKKNPMVRTVIYKPDGITHTDCEQASHSMQPILESYFPEGISLEVSSPGIGRILKTKREMEIFSGRTVRIHTQKNPQPILGTLKTINDDRITVGEENTNNEYQLAEITKITLQ